MREKEPGAPGLAGGETHHERVNRELIELLNELRVVLPGVQVLFAFLLSLPFLYPLRPAHDYAARRLLRLVHLRRGGDRAAHHALGVPSPALPPARQGAHALHLQPPRDRGDGVPGDLSLVGVIFVVTDVLYRSTFAAVVTALMSGWFAWFWYGLPLSRRLIDEDAGREQRDDASS